MGKKGRKEEIRKHETLLKNRKNHSVTWRKEIEKWISHCHLPTRRLS
jgi:hypothetical protein